MQLDGLKDIQSISSKKEIIDGLYQLGYLEDSPTFNAYQVATASSKINKLLGLELDNEQFQFFMTDKKRLLCEATAGSGKTTISQYKIIKRKLFYGLKGSRCLCLAFNRHSAKDMKARHRQLVRDIMKLNIKGVVIDDEISCRSFHSNAYVWVSEFYSECGLRYNKDLIASSGVIFTAMKKTAEAIFEKYNLKIRLKDATISALIDFNKFVRETLTKKEEWANTNPYQTLIQTAPSLKVLTLDMLEEIFAMFKVRKKITSNFDYTDILEMFLTLLKTNDTARERIQNYYKYIVADECQDLTPLLMESLKLMIGEDSYLVMIGDGDQSIYGFMGAEPDNCLHFKDHFPDGVVVSMSLNRRCPRNIVNVANEFIKTNTKRYEKNIYTTNDYGVLNNKLYSNNQSAYADIVNSLKNKSLKELSQTCICYRNKESSYLLTRALLDNDIPFRVGSGFTPYRDLLTHKLTDILNFMSNPKNKNWQKRALPILLPGVKKDEIAKQVNSFDEVMDWGDYDYNIDYPAFKESALVLHDSIKMHKAGKPLKEYFPFVFSLFRRHYWDFVSDSIDFDKALESVVLKDYFQDISYKELVDRMSKKKETIRRAETTGTGVLCTTFHTTKGLEFDDVIIVDLDDDIFPNFALIDSSAFSPEVKLDLKEECVRLLYVALTRAKKSLTLYWNKDKLSSFYNIIRKANYNAKVLQRDEKKEIAFDVDTLAIDESDLILQDTKSEVLLNSHNNMQKAEKETTQTIETNETVNEQSEPANETNQIDETNETVNVNEDIDDFNIDLESDDNVQVDEKISPLTADSEVKISLEDFDTGMRRVDRILSILKERKK